MVVEGVDGSGNGSGGGPEVGGSQRLAAQGVFGGRGANGGQAYGTQGNAGILAMSVGVGSDAGGHGDGGVVVSSARQEF